MHTGVPRAKSPSSSWVASWVVSFRSSCPLIQFRFSYPPTDCAAGTEKNAGMLVLTVTMVLVTGALETILWIFGFAAMIIAAHAATHVPTVQMGAEQQQLDNVV